MGPLSLFLSLSLYLTHTHTPTHIEDELFNRESGCYAQSSII